MTPETWRLEIVSDGSADIEKPRKLDDNTAIDLPALETLGKHHGVKFLKAMQCLNIAQPLGQGLVGRRAAARSAEAGRQGQATSAASTTRAFTTTIPSSSSNRRSATTR